MFVHFQGEELRSFNSTLTWQEDFRTKLQLTAMWLSNDYGNNWSRGVAFLLFFNLLFLIISSLDRDFNLAAYSTFIAEFFEFLFAFTTKPKFIASNWGVIWFYVSRIFILFGVYQTIAAFRKFGKSD